MSELIIQPQNVASFSGGRTSAYMVRLMQMLGMDVHYVFMDTGAEHPATYEFIRNIIKHWGIELTCLRVKYNPELGERNSYEIIGYADLVPDLGPWAGMVKKYGCPSVESPYCTSRMKTEPHDWYCDDRYGKGNYITWIGMRADEPNRLKEKTNVRYLAELSDFSKEDILDWWKEQPFDLGIPEHLGNCVFCIKKGLNKVALAAKDEPELATKFMAMAEGPHVRIEGRKHQHKRMYRQSLHLSDVIGMYSEVNAEDLRKRLRSSKPEAGSCSESCEVFQTDISDQEPSS